MYNISKHEFLKLLNLYYSFKHKIIEVKGPQDVLSMKQRLWMEYLNKIGLDAEVCFVQGNSYSNLMIYATFQN